MLFRISLLFFHQFIQRGLGEPLQKDGTQDASCETDGPSLTWYMNGVKQEMGMSKEPPFLLPVTPGSSSVLTLAERRGENCSDTWRKGEELLSVHFPPDSSLHSPAISLLLLLVVRTQPFSTFTLRDQNGGLTLNSSRLLLLDTRSMDINGSLKVKVSTEERGITRESVGALGFLSSRVEVPLLALVFGGTGVVAGILLINALVCCFLLKRKRQD
ncbi:hypothetical protein GDO86_012813 [Hymenochirus boettgeri]|uniref:Uncharacterized protein n=1 Tax=Hymenochirus boettgeri TaxID=247094 RepID=A0A8T2INT1_9PIPI|nr:hypothetical protein GDO86_012813 [Hymenochirus boettgeri]